MHFSPNVCLSYVQRFFTMDFIHQRAFNYLMKTMSPVPLVINLPLPSYNQASPQTSESPPRLLPLPLPTSNT